MIFSELPRAIVLDVLTSHYAGRTPSEILGHHPSLDEATIADIISAEDLIMGAEMLRRPVSASGIPITRRKA